VPSRWPFFCNSNCVLTAASLPARALGAGLVLALLILPASALALDVYWGSHPRKERLVLQFQDELPEVKLERTGAQTLTITPGSKAPLRRGIQTQPNFAGSRHFQALSADPDEVRITTRSPAFGYLHFTLPEQNKLVIDVFSDQLGAQWKPSRNKTGASGTIEQSDSKNGSAKEPAAAQPGPSGDRALQDPESSTQAAAKPRQRSKPVPPSPQGIDKGPGNDPKPSRDDRDAAKTSAESAQDDPSHPQPPVFRSKVTCQARAKPTDPQAQNQTLLKSDQVQNQGSLTGARPEPSASAAPHVVTREVSTGNVLPAQAQTNASRPENSTPKATPKDTSTVNATRADGNSTSRRSGDNDFSRSISAMMEEGKAALANGKWEAARSIFEQLARDPRTPESRRKDILHNLADALFSQSRNSLNQHYSEVTSALEEAINVDPDSQRVPLALLRLVTLNLKVGNEAEARGYFNVLKRSFPESRHVPAGHLTWGDHCLEQQDFSQAARHYRAIVEDNPKSSAALPATAGLIKTLNDLEFYDQAWTMIEYLKNRWPEYPLKHPELLRLSGLVAKETGRSKQAKDFLWRYCNLKPDSLQEDLTLARIGDIYLQMGKTQDAKKMYQKVVARYPDSQGGLIAKMRLAEESVNDKPTFTNMVSVFNRPYSLRPVKVYREIIQDHPESPLAPLALMKLAMWHVWDQNHAQALRVIADFENGYADSRLLPRVRDVGQRALKPLIIEAAKASRYAKALEIWNSSPQLHQGADPETHIAVALSLWKEGHYEQALDMSQPYLKQADLNSASESAVELVLNIHLANSSWKKILNVADTLDSEQLTTPLQNQLTYARALAHQNLMQEQQAGPLWEEVVNMNHVSDLQQGFASFFLAEQAMKDQRWDNVYILAQKAFRDLQSSDQATSKALECLDMLVQVTRRSGRALEALEWAHRYDDLLSPDSPDWPAARYKLANLYRQNGFLAKWEKNLQQLKSRYPQSLYGQMAASDLSERRLQKQARAFLDQ